MSVTTLTVIREACVKGRLTEQPGKKSVKCKKRQERLNVAILSGF